MRIQSDIELGVATNTGLVRSTNEDDFLVVVPHDRERLAQSGRLFAVADGMGGVTGGAEASRAALRALGRAFLDGDDSLDAEARVRRGFAEACRVVYELSSQSARLSDMGTTATVLLLVGGQGIVGHVGDSRCLLWRRGRLRQLTEDHAMSEPRNLLTRCIGAGQPSEEVDIVDLELAPGDVFVLLSDGVWSTVDAAEIARVLRTASPQDAAETLIRRANENGGPDNCTALIVRVRRTGGQKTRLREITLPAEEARPAPLLRARSRRLIPPRWPWYVLVLALLLGGLALAKSVYGVDLLRRALG